MAYEVIEPFADSQDKTKAFPDGRIYAIGENFPASKKKVSDERIAELASAKNRIGKAVIKEKSDE